MLTVEGGRGGTAGGSSTSRAASGILASEALCRSELPVSIVRMLPVRMEEDGREGKTTLMGRKPPSEERGDGRERLERGRSGRSCESKRASIALSKSTGLVWYDCCEEWVALVEEERVRARGGKGWLEDEREEMMESGRRAVGKMSGPKLDMGAEDLERDERTGILSNASSESEEVEAMGESPG